VNDIASAGQTLACA